MEINRAVSFFLFLSFFFHLASPMASAVAAKSEISENGEELGIAVPGNSTPLESQQPSRFHRLLGQYNLRYTVTCDEYPKICHREGSPGHSCCKKQCVNLKTDNLNCGRCGRNCKYGDTCCSRKCVNTMCDRKNCGGCHHECRNGSYCEYGMCSYA